MNIVAEFFSNNWETICVALVVALIGFFFWLIRHSIVIRIQRKEKEAEKIAKQKSEWLKKITKWADDCLDNINNNPPDTTPERIKNNRIKLSSAYNMRNEIVNISKTFSETLQQSVGGAAVILEDYYCYFDKGRRALHNIDDLPNVYKDVFSEVIKHILREKQKL